MYDVPLLPWLQAMSVLTNLFLMGSLGSLAYMRFGCTVAMLVYCLLFDMAHSLDGADAVAENIEQGKIKLRCPCDPWPPPARISVAPPLCSVAAAAPCYAPRPLPSRTYLSPPLCPAAAAGPGL